MVAEAHQPVEERPPLGTCGHLRVPAGPGSGGWEAGGGAAGQGKGSSPTSLHFRSRHCWGLGPVLKNKSLNVHGLFYFMHVYVKCTYMCVYFSVFIPWNRAWQPTPVFLPGESHGQSLAGYSPWGGREWEKDWATNTAVSIHTHYILILGNLVSWKLNFPIWH